MAMIEEYERLAFSLSIAAGIHRSQVLVMDSPSPPPPLAPFYVIVIFNKINCKMFCLRWTYCKCKPFDLSIVVLI